MLRPGLATRSVVPTPAIGISIQREESANVVLGTLSFDLPLFARDQAERGVASARVQQARVALAALERRASQEVRLAAERMRAARRVLGAFDPAMTAALAENLALVTKAYQAGQIDFVRYQLLRRDVLEARRDRIDGLEISSRTPRTCSSRRDTGGRAIGRGTSGPFPTRPSPRGSCSRRSCSGRFTATRIPRRRDPDPGAGENPAGLCVGLLGLPDAAATRLVWTLVNGGSKRSRPCGSASS